MLCFRIWSISHYCSPPSSSVASSVSVGPVDSAGSSALEEEVRSLVEQAGPLGLDVALLDERQRLAINNLQEVEVSDGRVKSIDQEDILVDHPILNELEKDLFSFHLNNLKFQITKVKKLI